jgi:hypothetical protein
MNRERALRGARALPVIALLVLAPGCLVVEDPGAPDREITCGHFADFLQSCTDNCSPTWDCEASYDSLDVETQIALDECSDCLVDNLAGGFCADCSNPEVGSCQHFMEELLGVDCW